MPASTSAAERVRMQRPKFHNPRTYCGGEVWMYEAVPTLGQLFDDYCEAFEIIKTRELSDTINPSQSL